MNAQWPHGKNRGVDYLVTALEALTALAAAGYVISGNVVMLVVWEAIAAGYLLGGLALTWYRSVRGQQVPPRTGVLDALSWIFPLVASLVGVNAALLAITVRAPVDGTRAGYTFTGVVAAVGIILSWQLPAHRFRADLRKRAEPPPPATGPGVPAHRYARPR
ncbi:hypothetical protein [Microbacterium aurum]